LVGNIGRWLDGLWECCWDSSRPPRVKVLSRYIEEYNMAVSSEGNKTIWRSIIPRNVNVFVWRALRGRLSVWTELDKKGIDLDSLLCPGCDNVVGSVDVFTIKDFLLHNGGVSMPKEAKALWSATIWVAAYMIWKNRNNKVFKGRTDSSTKVFQDIQLKAFEWVSRRSKKWNLQWEKWMERPFFLQLCGYY
ncbi:reverse transcriptase domain, reverse transcriptase zinc-binding domain protein, partial [Tanacetum coccineum]